MDQLDVLAFMGQNNGGLMDKAMGKRPVEGLVSLNNNKTFPNNLPSSNLNSTFTPTGVTHSAVNELQENCLIQIPRE